ncbi:hypothetical protein BDV95DRAFT_611725 [Massariosphaeria phaeospora]|uniref:Uncharacterized protein n=1 Tax=Massariosphaeria phaeospora TaxID=100035 RepID=A0A7C8M330_9PLEO|nr:hypothetical protein BDV95DRAFT_611725 [Massariosphaeria phaeospora]
MAPNSNTDSTDQTTTLNKKDDLSYTLETFKSQVLGTGQDFLQDFLYLPLMNKSKFEDIPDGFEFRMRFLRSDPVLKRMLVGTWTNKTTEETSSVWAYVHGRPDSAHVVSYFLDDTSNGVISKEILGINFEEPFAHVTYNPTRNRARLDQDFVNRVRIMVLFYFLEHGFLDRLVKFNQLLFGHACKAIADKAKSIRRKESRTVAQLVTDDELGKVFAKLKLAAESLICFQREPSGCFVLWSLSEDGPSGRVVELRTDTNDSESAITAEVSHKEVDTDTDSALSSPTGSTASLTAVLITQNERTRTMSSKRDSPIDDTNEIQDGLSKRQQPENHVTMFQDLIRQIQSHFVTELEELRGHNRMLESRNQQLELLNAESTTLRKELSETVKRINSDHLQALSKDDAEVRAEKSKFDKEALTTKKLKEEILAMKTEVEELRNMKRTFMGLARTLDSNKSTGVADAPLKSE